jgi:hypothetical protein
MAGKGIGRGGVGRERSCVCLMAEKLLDFAQVFRSNIDSKSLIFRQIDQGLFAHFGRPIVKDALHLLKRLVDGRFVGQQGVCDVEVALFFGPIVGTRFSAR